MKLSQRKFFLSYFLPCIIGLCLPLMIWGQNENQLLHLHQYDEYTDFQLLPNGTCRLFAISKQPLWYNNNHAIYTDIEPGAPLDSMEVSDLTVPAHFFNFAVSNLFALHLKDGATLLSNTQFDCDFDPPGGLMMLDHYGEVVWIKDFYLENIFETGGEMVFIDFDAILIKDMYAPGEGFIIDRQGEILDIPIPPNPYDETIETSYGFVARLNDRLDVLDTAFQVLFSYNLDQEIQTIKPLGQERFMIRTDAKFYELDTNGSLEYLPLSASQNSMVWTSSKHYWALANTQHAVIKMDSFFTPVDTLSVPPGVDIKVGFASSDVYVVGEYVGNIGRNIISFKGAGEDLKLELPYDIGITGISIPDTVWVDPSDAPLWGAWTYSFEFVDVEVTNFGADTVFHYNVESLAASYCDFCSGYNSRWEINSPLPPGMSTTIALGPFSPNCMWNTNSPLCITTTTPNNKADGNFENDKYCQPINTIIVANDEPEAFVKAQFYPNPADDQLNIELSNPNYNGSKGSVFDFTGHLIKRFEINSQQTSLSVVNWPPGIYVVRVTGRSGKFITRKLVVQH